MRYTIKRALLILITGLSAVTRERTGGRSRVAVRVSLDLRAFEPTVEQRTRLNVGLKELACSGLVKSKQKNKTKQNKQTNNNNNNNKKEEKNDFCLNFFFGGGGINFDYSSHV